MQDIKIPDPSSKNPDFGMKHVLPTAEEKPREPSEKVKVKFEKFVQLIAMHNFEEVMKKHAEADIILNTNLLTDLANAHMEEQPSGRRLPIMFIVGIIIGIVVTYLLLRF